MRVSDHMGWNTQQQESTSHDSDSSDVNSLAGSHSSDGHGPFESHEGKMGSVHLDNTPVMQSSPTRMMLGLSEVTGQSSAQSSYRSEWPISSQHPGDPKLAHEADTPPLLNVRVDSTPVPPEPHVLNPEVAQLPWRAPLQLHERGQCLLQALSERHEGARGRPAQDVDSGLRLYEEDVLPPPYSAE
ncbi:hypothetical protein C8Q76DRAFT_762502 [Earliella scabrosa]|nr:hypothetical protein C8Q76DRAFT_762502 [Earliella scabrosa]